MRTKLSVIYLSGIIIVITSYLITLFLSEQIIDIPEVTPEGEIIRALGVAIIIITMINLSFFALIILQKIDEKRDIGD